MSGTTPTDMIPLLGFAPDADPTTPGALSDCTLLVPNHRGFVTPPSIRYGAGTYDVGATAGAYAATATYAGSFFSAEFNVLFIAHRDSANTIGMRLSENGTAFRTAALSATAMATVTDVAFAQFGAQVIASVYPFGLFSFEPGPAIPTDFTAVDTSDNISAVFKHLLVAERFVIGLNGRTFDTPANGDVWACSARDNHASWTAAPSTLANSGRLPDAYGDIVGGAVLGSRVIAFKSRTAYIGEFIGAPEVWGWSEWPYRIGAICPPAVYRDAVIFLAHDGLYLFDGATVKNLMDGAMQQFMIDNALFNYYARVIVDTARNRAYVGGSADGNTDGSTIKWYVCHIPTGKWGRATLPNVEAYFAGPSRFNPNGGYDLSPTDTLYAIKRSDKTVHTVKYGYDTSAQTAQPSFVFNDFGDAFKDIDFGGARIKFIHGPQNATMTPMHRNTLDGALSTAAPVARNSDGDFDHHHNARWHRAKFEITNATATVVEMASIRVGVAPRGQR